MAEPEPKSTEKFHLFSRLPSELRIKIWRATLCPRKIPYYCLWDGYVRPPPLPAAFSINKESREEALPHYVSFSTLYTDEDGENERVVCTTMVAPAFDILEVPLTTFPGAPLFMRLADINSSLFKSIAFVETWLESLTYLTEEFNRKLDYMRPIIAEQGSFRGNEPMHGFSGLKLWTLVIRKRGDATDEELKEALKLARTWCEEMDRCKDLTDFRTPAVLRLIDYEGEELASLQGTRVVKLMTN